MVVQCPKCAARFKIADHLVAGKTVKLKCSKCQHVFVFGSGVQAPEAQRPSHPRMPVVKPPAAVVVPPAPAPIPVPIPAAAPAVAPALRPAAPASPATPDPPAGESFESFEPAPGPSPLPGDTFESMAPPQPPEPEPGQAPEPGSEPAREASVPESLPANGPADRLEPSVVVDDTAAASAPKPVPLPSRPPSAPGLPSYPSQPSIITLEDVLPAAEPSSGAAKAVAISFIVLFGTALLFVLFVLLRNGWDFSGAASDPVLAVKVAIGMAPHVEVPEQARGIETSVVETLKVETGDEREIFLVNGEIFNTTVFPKDLVMVKVSIVSASGEEVGSQEVIAGVELVPTANVGKLSVLEIEDRMIAEAHDARAWIVRSQRKASFQAMFTNIPPAVDDPALYRVEAIVTSAANAQVDE